MAGPWYLGNDVVALRSPRARNKTRDGRFLERVFTPREREAVLAAPFPDGALWLLWAGKESLYKGVTKALGSPPPFQHNRFRVSFPTDALGRGPEMSAPLFGRVAETHPIRGRGSYGELTFRIGAHWHPERIHAVAWLGEGQGREPPALWGMARLPSGEPATLGKLRGEFSPEEWACVAHLASAHTRMGARRALASALGVEAARVEIRCGPGSPGRRVPLAYLDGRELEGVELSLSHDRDLASWVFLPRE